MLVSKKMRTIIIILLSSKNSTITEIAKKARITVAMASRILYKLESSGYVKIGRNSIDVPDVIKLTRALSYLYSIREFPTVQFVAAGRPQYLMKKIMRISKESNPKLRYAFTLFSATEHVSPYVAPANTYMYIPESEIELWKKEFEKENIILVQEEKTFVGNIICLPIEENFFDFGVRKVHNDISIVTLPVLYADLFSFGGRGLEASDYIFELIVENERVEKNARNI